ncbi:cytochrome b/b6 domain-containing protein [Noviherbaspirillum saxi]|uniref:Cytochrome B n=1 Tax=Noviherbaspirillum saxi TaxID=2320863 RepID=A0A3A3GBG7_9BURK|nr:cytochrome b/b6 domain-containing protein [Noviherbaspirillum saxi]RJF99535.1 cytochrome B [Noviherbaspirillum saxi]
MKKVRVWDLPVRLFHWMLAILILVSIITQQIGGNAMEWHFRSGYAVLALVGFRIIWGLVGSRYARFVSFLHGPSTIVGYLRGGKDALKGKYIGHNPLGSLSVFAMLGVVAAQAISGLYANDDIASEGPLVKFISKDLSDQITWFHKEVSANLLYLLVAMHLLAIAVYYFRKKQDLVTPMLTGDQHVEFDAPHANDGWGMRLLALLIVAVSALAVYYLVSLPPRGA